MSTKLIAANANEQNVKALGGMAKGLIKKASGVIHEKAGVLLEAKSQLQGISDVLKDEYHNLNKIQQGTSIEKSVASPPRK